MFNKETEKNFNRGAETIIGQSIRVKGDFHGDGDIIIEGTVEGDISTKQFLSVSTSAVIIANISANSAKIAGDIKGNLHVSTYLEILSSAKIIGDISAKELSIEKGAIVQGKINMNGQEMAANQNN